MSQLSFLSAVLWRIMLKSRKQHKKNLLQNSLRILKKYFRCWCWTDWENTLEHSEEWKELPQEEFVTWGGRDLLVFCFVFVFVFVLVCFTAVADQRNLGQIIGENILVYSWRTKDRQRLGFGPSRVPCYVPETLRRTSSFDWKKLRERLLIHERCCSLWLRYDSWVNRLSHNCVAVMTSRRAQPWVARHPRCKWSNKRPLSNKRPVSNRRTPWCV